MTIYLLEPVRDWDPPFDGWDIPIGFVVRADTADDARTIASADPQSRADIARAWLDPLLTTCRAIDSGGRSEVILRADRMG